MNRFLKILFLVLLVLPIWLTIVAFAGTETMFDSWKEKFNSQLLESKTQRIQITEILARPSDFDEAFKNSSFELDMTGIRKNGISEISVKFFDATGRLEKLSRIRAKLFIQEEVTVATRNLNMGEVVDSSSFRTEWRDASKFHGSPIHGSDLIGRAVRGNIAENEVIYDSKIQKSQLVSRGDRVKISVISSGLTISGMGIAQEGGSKGQTIKVINGDSRKEILGIVTASRAVEVRL